MFHDSMWGARRAPGVFIRSDQGDCRVWRLSMIPFYAFVDPWLIGRFGFKHLFAFTALGLIPCLMSTMLVDMAQRVIIEGYDVSVFIGPLLASSPIVGRHTSVIHLIPSPDGVQGRKYIWAHPDLRPWGRDLPPQCPKCGSFKPWGKKKKRGDGSYSFQCEYGHGCMGVFISTAPKQEYTTIPNSEWLSFEWPLVK